MSLTIYVLSFGTFAPRNLSGIRDKAEARLALDMFSLIEQLRLAG